MKETFEAIVKKGQEMRLKINLEITKLTRFGRHGIKENVKLASFY